VKGFRVLTLLLLHCAALGQSAALAFVPDAGPAPLRPADFKSIDTLAQTQVRAGNIPGATRTLAVAIYGYAETGQDSLAFALVLVSVGIAFVALWTANRLVERGTA